MRKYIIIFMFIFVLIVLPVVISHYNVSEDDIETCPAEDCPDEELSVAEKIVQDKLRNASYLSIAIAILGIVLIIWYYANKIKKVKKKRKKKERIWLKAITPILIWILIVLIIFSYYYFRTTASESEGIIVCESGECFWAAHIHSVVHAEVCGEEINLGLEEGRLEGTHTHKERGRLHFHERLSVDEETLEITDFTPLNLGMFFKSIDIRFNATCIGEKCNGDTCDGGPGKLTMNVNGVPNNEFDQYIWKEGDEIEIKFE